MHTWVVNEVLKHISLTILLNRPTLSYMRESLNLLESRDSIKDYGKGICVQSGFLSILLMFRLKQIKSLSDLKFLPDLGGFLSAILSFPWNEVCSVSTFLLA